MDDTQPDLNSIISNAIVTYCDRIFATLRLALGPRTDRVKNSMSTYLHITYKQLARTKTFAIRESAVDLRDIYIQRRLKHGLSHTLADSIRAVETLGRRVLLTGQGGTGKTTVTRFLALDAIHRPSHLPIYLVARDLAEFRGGLFNVLLSHLNARGLEIDADALSNLLDSSLVTVIIDGLDEVSPALRADLRRAVNDLSLSMGGHMILTSRPSLDFEQWSEFTTATIAPLTKEEAVELIRRVPSGETVKNLEFCRRLEDQYFVQYQSFAENPLLLQVMLVSFSVDGVIQDNLHLFLGSAFYALWLRHDAMKEAYQRGRRTKLTANEFLGMLDRFCALTYRDRRYEISNVDTIDYLSRATRNIADVNLFELKLDLIEAVCLLWEDDVRVHFVHRKFQEYFAARYLAATTSKRRLAYARSILDRAHTDEVLTMFNEMAPDSCRQDVITPLLQDLASWMSGTDADSNSVLLGERMFESFNIRVSDVSGFVTFNYRFEELNKMRVCTSLSNTPFKVEDSSKVSRNEGLDLIKWIEQFESVHEPRLRSVGKDVVKETSEASSSKDMTISMQALKQIPQALDFVVQAFISPFGSRLAACILEVQHKIMNDVEGEL